MGGLGFLVFVVVVATTIWVGVDASQREWEGSGTATWVVGCILLWIVVFPLYLVKRGRAPLRQSIAARPSAIAPSPTYRECPHCKEAMRRDASTCPHCRKESPAWRFHEGRWWQRDTTTTEWRWYDETTSQWVAMQAPN